MAADKLACYLRCGDNRKTGSALGDHMKKDTIGLFGTYADPQRTLQKLREYTSKGNEAKHEELFKRMDIEAFNNVTLRAFTRQK